MNLQSLINGPLGVSLGILLGKLLPYKAGISLSQYAAGRLANMKHTPMVRAVRVNQWMVSGRSLGGVELDQQVLNTIKHAASTIYLFNYYNQNSNKMDSLVNIPDKIDQLLSSVLSPSRGIILAGIHLGNFDLVMQALARQFIAPRGLRVLVLSAPQPGKGYRLQNRIRMRTGLEIIPVSVASIRQAITTLNEGGIVVTGLDRPIQDGKYKPFFFGSPAALPVLHISLALKTGAPVAVVSSFKEMDNHYRFEISEPIYIKQASERHQEIVDNAQVVLATAEQFIRQSPDQWSMFYPVWPQYLEDSI
jgi:KDO2-lipid IV(A) lauroyltransferase